MDLKENKFNMFNICMLLPFPRYGANMRIPPQIGILNYLSNFGHRISWILWSDEPRELQSLSPDGICIYAIEEIRYLSNSSLKGRLINKLLNRFKKMGIILNKFRENDYNLILVRDDVFDGIIAVYIKWKYRVPFIFVLSNPLEQELEYFKIIPKRPYLIHYLVIELKTFLAIRLLYKADLVMPISKWLKDDLAARVIPEAKIMAVSEGIDVEAFRCKGGRDICEKYDISKSKIIIYVGTLGKGRCLKLLIQAFSEVKKRREDVKLLIVGTGDDEGSLKKFCIELGINNDTIFTGQVSQAEVPNFIAASAIGVSPVPPFSFYKMSSPIKMFEYMAMAKPVIANEEIPEHKDVLKQSGGGILVPFTSEGFAGAIIDLLDDSEKAVEMGQRGQNWVAKNRTFEIMARLVEKRFQLLLEKERVKS